MRGRFDGSSPIPATSCMLTLSPMGKGTAKRKSYPHMQDTVKPVSFVYIGTFGRNRFQQNSPYPNSRSTHCSLSVRPFCFALHRVQAFSWSAWLSWWRLRDTLQGNNLSAIVDMWKHALLLVSRLTNYSNDLTPCYVT